ncbi:SDR family oxidoreductase [Amycolatopsis ultiminotia]|uniref:SDR family oxidoreductase n=1 Tax=Amycolatopsis ultiminotia TaxID=543629 RepID=A0ABP6UY38_9PSEU
MNPSLFSLENAVALVTGASGGIGARIASGLAGFGASVGCVDLPGSAVDETCEAIGELGGKSAAIFADVRAEEQLTAAVAEVEATLGPLTHAVNCAGINNQVPAESMSRTSWQDLIDANLTGIFLSCKAEGIAMMRNGGGSIVNIGSISASIANRGLSQVHYNSAKAGVVHLTKSLAVEWSGRGVRVNAVSPGYTATPMARHPEVWPHVQAYVKDIPLGRMAEPDELVGPAVFLLSAAGSYCTGVDLLVDGGATVW